MSDALTERLNAIIQDASLDGTLSKRAIDQFQTLLEENASLKAQVGADARALKELKKDYDTLVQRSEVLRNEIEGWAGREQDLLDREAQAEVLAMSLKYEQKRVEDHKNMVGLVFRNTLLRKQAMTPGHAGHVDQYGNQQGQEWPTKHDLEEKEE